MFDPDDEVQHKLGGAVWTVAAVDGDQVTCERLKDGEIKRETFDADSLTMYEPPKARAVRSVKWPW